MKSESITIKDIANLLGLSYSTVARSIKDSYQISEETKEIVRKCAKEHNYRPNLMAQTLKGKKSRCIGLLLSQIPNNFFAEVTGGIESVASSKDNMVIIAQNYESYKTEVRNFENLISRSIDGLLISLSSETEDLSHFQKLINVGFPVVFFDRVPESIQAHKVIADNFLGSYKATLHLIKKGYKKIAHITSAPNLSITKERLEGYLKAITDSGIPLNGNFIKYCMHGGFIYEEIENAISELFSLDNPPDALLAASDRLTIGSFKLINKLRITIPDQLGLIGFSNFSSPELFHPPLTTVRQHAIEMGKVATELLFQLIESKKPIVNFQTKKIATELCIRNSC